MMFDLNVSYLMRGMQNIIDHFGVDRAYAC